MSRYWPSHIRPSTCRASFTWEESWNSSSTTATSKSSPCQGTQWQSYMQVHCKVTTMLDICIQNVYLSLVFFGDRTASKSVAKKSATTCLYIEREQILINLYAHVLLQAQHARSLPCHTHILIKIKFSKLFARGPLSLCFSLSFVDSGIGTWGRKEGGGQGSCGKSGQCVDSRWRITWFETLGDAVQMDGLWPLPPHFRKFNVHCNWWLWLLVWVHVICRCTCVWAGRQYGLQSITVTLDIISYHQTLELQIFLSQCKRTSMSELCLALF